MTLLLGSAAEQLLTRDWDSEKRAYGPEYERDVKDLIVSDFAISKSDLEGFEVLAYYSSPSDYEMNCWFLLSKDGQYFEASGGHCSCYGYEGQWEPKVASLEYLTSNNFGGWSLGAEEKAQVKALLGA